jgi:zinc transport system substrate-binding protein
MIRQFCILSFLVLFLFACSPRQVDVINKTVTVSIPPQAYFIQRIAGTEYGINILVPPGTGPETYEPSPRDLENVSKSDFCVLSGYLDFETQLTDKIKTLRNSPEMINISDTVDLIRNAEHGEIIDNNSKDTHHHPGGVDPHYWMSPREMKKVTLLLSDILIRKNPGRKNIYSANRDSLLRDITLLDSTLHSSFKILKTRKFILYHPSLSYLARDYQLEQLALEKGGKQPSTRQIVYLVDIAKKEGIHTIFLQTQFDDNVMKSLARDISGKLDKIDPLAADWLNNMNRIGKQLKEAMDGK